MDAEAIRALLTLRGSRAADWWNRAIDAVLALYDAAQPQQETKIG